MGKKSRPEAEIQKSARRLRAAREKRFETATEFAKAIGVKVPAYTHHENGNRAFEFQDAQRYAGPLGVSAGYLMGNDGKEAETPEVTVMCSAALGVWIDRSIDIEHKKNKKSLPVPNPSGIASRFAVEVKDDSINYHFAVGEYAICRPMGADELKEGQLVYVEHRRGDLVQTTIRRVYARPKGVFALKTDSRLAHFNGAPLNYPLETKEESITIKGLVIGRYAVLPEM